MCFSPARVSPTPYCFGPAAVNMQRAVCLIYCVLSSVDCLGHWRDTKSKDILSGEETLENRAIMWISVEDYVGTITSNWDSELFLFYCGPLRRDVLITAGIRHLSGMSVCCLCHAYLISVSMVTHILHRKWVNWFLIFFLPQSI